MSILSNIINWQSSALPTDYRLIINNKLYQKYVLE